MNEYKSDIELVGGSEALCLIWNSVETYSERLAGFCFALAFMSMKAPEYDDIKFLFDYCRVRIND